MSAVDTTRRRRTIAFRALRFRQAVWLVPAVFAVHVLEEAPGFTDWVNRYASEQYSSDDFVRINALGLLLTAGATLVVARTNNRTVFFVFYSTILTQQALWNTVFHVGSGAGFGAYSPGVVTSLLLLLPLWWHLTRLALSERLISRRAVAAAALIGGPDPRRRGGPAGVLRRVHLSRTGERGVWSRHGSAQGRRGARRRPSPAKPQRGHRGDRRGAETIRRPLLLPWKGSCGTRAIEFHARAGIRASVQ